MIQVQLKLRPTKAQARTLDRWLWRLTGVWNWATKKLEANPRLSSFDLQASVAGHGRKVGVSQDAISGTVKTVVLAHQRFRDGMAGRPKLKGRRRRLSSIAFSHWDQRSRRQRIQCRRMCVPVLGMVRFHAQDVPIGHVGTARIVKRASGWYLCLFIQADPKPVVAIADGEVGIDPGFSSLLTLSTGEKIQHPHELAVTARRLAQAQRGGRKRLAAGLHERIANQRKNRNHHLSRRLVAENQLIAFSKDNHAAIARTFGKSVTSAGHHQLRSMLALQVQPYRRSQVHRSAISKFHQDVFGVRGLDWSHWLARSVSEAMGVCDVWGRARAGR